MLPTPLLIGYQLSKACLFYKLFILTGCPIHYANPPANIYPFIIFKANSFVGIASFAGKI